ncbi:hypothetical protein CRUP_000356 [Coryphaenoides rupestris]|nr:hypothetical protein CRUP_000356 [Coryphaenoides rupestris]
MTASEMGVDSQGLVIGSWMNSIQDGEDSAAAHLPQSLIQRPPYSWLSMLSSWSLWYQYNEGWGSPPTPTFRRMSQPVPTAAFLILRRKTGGRFGGIGGSTPPKRATSAASAALFWAHWPSMDSFHRVTWTGRQDRQTARMFPVMDQLTCQTTSLNLCSSLAFQVFPVGAVLPELDQVVAAPRHEALHVVWLLAGRLVHQATRDHGRGPADGVAADLSLIQRPPYSWLSMLSSWSLWYQYNEGWGSPPTPTFRRMSQPVPTAAFLILRRKTGGVGEG